MSGAASAIVVKDVKYTLRSPTFLVLSVLVPTLFVGMFALVIQTSATVPVGIESYDPAPAGNEFLSVVQGLESADGSSYHTVAGEPQEIRQAYQSGRIPGYITIPTNFGTALATAGHAPVRIRVFNIDSDATKNLHLRLERAARHYNHSVAPSAGRVSVAETTVYARETPMSRYFGSALLVFAILYIAIVNTGILIAEEWEMNTAKALVLSPSGLWALIRGKAAAAGALGIVGFAFVVGAIALTLGYPVSQLGITSWVYLVLIAIYGAAIGTLLGVHFRSSLIIVPVSAVISITHLLLCGFESYIRGFAHDGVLAWLWRAGAVWPVSWLTDDIRMQVEQLSAADFDLMALTAMSALTIGLVVVAVLTLRRRLAFTQGM